MTTATTTTAHWKTDAIKRLLAYWYDQGWTTALPIEAEDVIDRVDDNMRLGILPYNRELVKVIYQ